MSALIGSDSATEDIDVPAPAAPTSGAPIPGPVVTYVQSAPVSATTSVSTTTPSTSTDTGSQAGSSSAATGGKLLKYTYQAKINRERNGNENIGKRKQRNVKQKRLK